MPIQILMPALSPTMTEGNLVKWHKSEGDEVASGDVIAEIETDKATMEVEAVDEGVIGKIMIAEGAESVQVNSVIAWLLEDGESADEIPDETSSPVTTATAKSVELVSSISSAPPHELAASSDSVRAVASPLAKRIANQQGVSLSGIQGTGPRGRIVKDDVLSQGQSGSGGANDHIQTGPRYEDIFLNGMRKTIAKRLQESKQTIPHFYLSVDCELDNLLKVRKQLNEVKESKVSVNDFIVMACAKAIKDVPAINATWHETFVRQYQNIDVCVAVATDGGLITPIVTNADKKSLLNISTDVKDLAGRAREGKLQPHEYQGGGFTISNLGMFGVKNFDAIINPPQVAILSVGAGEKRAVVKCDDVKVATVMSCTVSLDHRAIDGAVGALFLKAFKQYIENPALMLG